MAVKNLERYDACESMAVERKVTCRKCSHTRKKKNDKCLSVNEAKGTFYCHHCHWTGNLAELNGNGNGNSNGNHANTHYLYCDEQGQALYRKVRSSQKNFWFEHPDGAGGWTSGATGIRRVPYRLTELIKSEATVYIVEGEKDVDTLVNHGLVATCNDSGAGKWKPEFNEFLKDRDVVVLEDNDKPGRKHGKVISEGLYGVARSIKIVRFTELDKGGDVTDFLKTHSKDDLIVRQKDAPEFMGSYSKHFKDDEETCSEIEWEEPVLFDQIETPEIGVDVLPSWLGNYAKAVSRNSQTPFGMAVMMGLSVVATCLQKRFVVSPYGDDYVEPLSLWTATILPPGTRKTAVLSAMTAPLSDWECEMARNLKNEIAENETIRMVNEKKLDRLQNEETKCKEHDERKLLLAEITQLKLDNPEEMYPPRLWTGDVTPERLQNLLAEHGERMSLLSDEGGIFEIMSGLYSNGAANIDVFLKGHAGSSIRVDRGNREAHLKAPALSFGLTIQPEVASLLGQGNKKHFRGNGTLARFMFCLPKSNVGHRNISQREPIPETIKAAYCAGIFHLLYIVDIVDEDGASKPRIIGLDNEALTSWERFAQYIESNQGENNQFESIQDWTGKLPGAALRIAGLCHVVEHGEGSPMINKKTLEAALDLCDSLIIHAQATFELMGGDEQTTDAKHILKWMLKRKDTFFKRRDCQQELRGRFRRVDKLVKALDVLIERNFVSKPEMLPTRKPTIIYHINPKLLKEGKDGLA